MLFNSFRGCAHTRVPRELKTRLSLGSQTTTLKCFPFGRVFPSTLTTLVTTPYIPPTHDVILCHGLSGFSHIGPVNYFRGVEDDLKRLGCSVFAPQVDPFGGVEKRTGQLHKEVNDYLTRRYGSAASRSVHLIGHSMGGLDSRRLVHMDPKTDYDIMSITTVSTPHRGSPMAAWSESLNPTTRAAAALPLAFVHEVAPALEDLRSENMVNFNRNFPDVAAVKYYSVGSHFIPWITHIFYFPHEFISNSHHDPMHVKAFGANDGMVSEDSAKWGETLDFIQERVSHFGVIGWELFPVNLGGSDSHFDHKRLYRRLVDNVARKVEGKAN